MAYASWSVVFGEQPSAAKWNILGTNDASFNDGTGLNSGSVQQQVNTLSTAVATGTTLIPADDTIPQNTEGDQYLTQAITPKNTANTLIIEAAIWGSSSVITHLAAALFQDSTANALAAASVYQGTGFGEAIIYLRHTMAAGTTSSTTFKVRAGGANAGTFTFNGVGGARIYGAITKSSIVIREYKA
jgi:hypothetical protein